MMMNKMMKKAGIVFAATAIAIVGTVTTASAEVNFEYTKTESTTETKTVKDSMGNEYEVTHMIETVNGETQEIYKNVPLEVINETGKDISELYFSATTSDTWGENLFDLIETDVLEDGKCAAGLEFGYNPAATRIDIKIVKTDGTYVVYPDCGFENLEDGTHIYLDFFIDSEGNNRISIS